MTETNISRVHCPKCGAVAVKNGFKRTRKGRKQRWLCHEGHTFHTLHLPEDLR